MGPRGLGPKIINIIQIIQNHEHLCFFSTWKRCASRFCEGSSERQLQIIDMGFFEQIVFLKIGEKVSKV